MSDAVRYEAQDAIGVITLNRPDNRNSMTPELLDAFARASAAARADVALRCVVVTGAGSCFSSGADFKATPDMPRSARHPVQEPRTPPSPPTHQTGALQRDGGTPSERSYAMYEPFLSLLDLEVPVIGALNGHAVGGGFGLALICDLRIGAVDAKYGANFVRLGLAPGLAISYLLPRLVGVARASELLLTGRLVDGRTAEALGILNHAVPAGDVLPQSMALAREIAEAAPLAVRATKAAIRRGLGLAPREAARAESFAQAESLATEDAREGITALLAKRRPAFTGR